MKPSNFADCIIKTSKIKETDFQERLEEILTGKNERKEKEKKQKEEEEKYNKQIKHIENEKKINFLLGIDEDTPSITQSNTKENIKDKGNKIFDQKELEEINSENIFEQTKIPVLISNDNKDEKIFPKNDIKQNLTLNDLIKKSNKKPNKITAGIPQKYSKNSIITPQSQPIQVEKDELISIQKKPLNIVKTGIQKKQNKLSEEPKEKKENANKNTLLLRYHQEKKTNEQLSSILSNNQAVYGNDYFSNQGFDKKEEKKRKQLQFYDYHSQINKLEKAKEILFSKLTPGETQRINEMNEQIMNFQKETQRLLEEKAELESEIKEIKINLSNSINEHNKELNELKKRNENEIRSIINKFKLELYKEELKPSGQDNIIPTNLQEKRKEYQAKIKELKKVIEEDNKFYISESNDLNEVLKKINISNEVLLAKVKSYQEDKIWKSLISKNSQYKSEELSKELNQLIKIKELPEESDSEKPIVFNRRPGTKLSYI